MFSNILSDIVILFFVALLALFLIFGVLVPYFIRKMRDKNLMRRETK